MDFGYLFGLVFPVSLWRLGKLNHLITKNMKTKEFHLSDILSVLTDKKLSENGMDGVYGLLSFMTETEINEFVVEKAMKSCRLAIVEEHPQLSIIDIGINNKNLKKWVNRQITKFGERLPISVLSVPFK